MHEYIKERHIQRVVIIRIPIDILEQGYPDPKVSKHRSTCTEHRVRKTHGTRIPREIDLTKTLTLSEWDKIREMFLLVEKSTCDFFCRFLLEEVETLAAHMQKPTESEF